MHCTMCQVEMRSDIFEMRAIHSMCSETLYDNQHGYRIVVDIIDCIVRTTYLAPCRSGRWR